MVVLGVCWVPSEVKGGVKKKELFSLIDSNLGDVENRKSLFLDSFVGPTQKLYELQEEVEF